MTEMKATDWSVRANGKYEKLGWVSNSGLLDYLAEIAQIKQSDIVVDVATGSQAVLKAIVPKLNSSNQAIGFDISPDMISRSETKVTNNLFVADALELPLPNNFVDLVTARMVYHHIPAENIPKAVTETKRILKVGGKFIVCEYVASNPEVWEFERKVFDIKEPERNLWLAENLKQLLSDSWEDPSRVPVLTSATLQQYSVKDWMEKSGLPIEQQTSILDLYLKAPSNIIKQMNITFTSDGDALVDRPFAHVILEK